MELRKLLGRALGNILERDFVPISMKTLAEMRAGAEALRGRKISDAEFEEVVRNQFARVLDQQRERRNPRVPKHILDQAKGET